MDKCFVFAGLFLNLIGVILLYKGIGPLKDGPPIGGDQTSDKNTGRLVVVIKWALRSGLFCLIVGIILQLVGVYLSML